jgi:C-terminal processing protease CtpA/Prc
VSGPGSRRANHQPESPRPPHRQQSQIADADAAIIDLRNNNGGFPPTEQRVASYFFDAEPVHLKNICRRDTDQTWEIWTEKELRGSRFGSKKPSTS